MRKYILLLSIIFLSFAFKSDGIVGWYELSYPVTKQITSISFTDTLSGWAVTNNGPPYDTAYALKTTNGGVNWTIELRGSYSLTKTQFFKNGRGYICGAQGAPLLYRTDNNGANWTDLSTNVPVGNLDDMFFINQDTGWVTSGISLFGGIAKTTNGGLNWQLQLGPNPHPKQVFFANASTGWAITNFDVYKTTNGGTNWTTQYHFTLGILKLSAPTTDTLYMTGVASGGHYNAIWKSTNAGNNWFSQTVFDPDNTACLNIFMLNSKRGWISCGDNIGRILKITDGETWKIQSAPIANYYSIQFLDTSKGFSGGTKFITTRDGGGPVTAINNISNQIPENFKLYQNYPNPFNPLTRINYEIQITNYVTLKVFDLQGREIQTLVNKKQSEGSYSVEFNASNLPSGAYFYRLETENYSETKKMLLVK